MATALKPKNAKDEIIDFILRYDMKHGIIKKKTEQIKISDDCYSGENLDHEYNFLHELEQKIEEKFDDSSSSTFFGKRTMSLCVEMKEELNEEKIKKLLELIDWITDEHFRI